MSEVATENLNPVTETPEVQTTQATEPEPEFPDLTNDADPFIAEIWPMILKDFEVMNQVVLLFKKATISAKEIEEYLEKADDETIVDLRDKRTKLREAVQKIEKELVKSVKEKMQVEDIDPEEKEKKREKFSNARDSARGSIEAVVKYGEVRRRPDVVENMKVAYNAVPSLRGVGAKGGGSGSSTRTSKETQAIREWARENGHKVSERGRISEDVLKAYEEAHKS